MKIPLTKGLFAIVDAKDYKYLSRFKWYAIKYRNYSYAGRAEYRKSSKGKMKQITIRMHREIMMPPAGVFVDHKDGNTLNNKRSNLRFATRSQNGANAAALTSPRHGYRGVVKVWNKWSSIIRDNGTRRYLGSFSTKKEAHLAFVAAHRKIHGEYSFFNR